MNTAKKIQNQNPVPKNDCGPTGINLVLTSSVTPNQFTQSHLSGKWGYCFIPVKGSLTEAAFLLHFLVSSYSFMLLNISAVSPFPACVNSTFFVP